MNSVSFLCDYGILELHSACVSPSEAFLDLRFSSKVFRPLFKIFRIHNCLLYEVHPLPTNIFVMKAQAKCSVFRDEFHVALSRKTRSLFKSYNFGDE